MLGEVGLVSPDSKLYSTSNVVVLHQNGKANPNAFSEGSSLFTGVKLISLKIDLCSFS